MEITNKVAKMFKILKSVDGLAIFMYCCMALFVWFIHDLPERMSDRIDQHTAHKLEHAQNLSWQSEHSVLHKQCSGPRTP